MEIRTLEPRRVREAAKVLAEAFTDEPLVTQLLPLGTLHRQRKIADYFVWNMRRTGLRTVDVAIEGDRIVGVALWRAPGHVSRWLPELPAKTGVLLRGVGRRGLRVLGAHDAACADKHPNEPYWHLVGVGTAQHHARGTRPATAPDIEAALVSHRLREIDEAGSLASLEARTPQHVSQYEALGFSHQCELSSPAVSTVVMWRSPRAGRSRIAA
ncbi:hypothetical protein FB468_1449 [Leucobacter komagatae]|uniref:N-acetyltransferase domain-containing protein n=1 Tax=Leucobacter komagatae TaxID=55969 RepID=A0A542Y5R0_9MICO|nr:hypothetical protein [Leucobacter komagatae]TQL43428.1 hypothetical protein FB468_1449 [Leucobacter komagatae]